MGSPAPVGRFARRVLEITGHLVQVRIDEQARGVVEQVARAVQARTTDLPVTDGQVAYPGLAYAGNADALQASDQPTGEHVKMPTVVAERKSGHDHGHNHIARIKDHRTPSAMSPEDWHAVGTAGIKLQFHFRSTT
jgi:hypothetical protein